MKSLFWVLWDTGAVLLLIGRLGGKWLLPKGYVPRPSRRAFFAALTVIGLLLIAAAVAYGFLGASTWELP